MLNLKSRLFSGERWKKLIPKSSWMCEPWPLISYHELLPLLSIRAPPPCCTTPVLLVLRLSDVKRRRYSFHPTLLGEEAPSSLCSAEESPTIENPAALKMHKKLWRGSSGNHMFVSSVPKIGHLMTSWWKIDDALEISTNEPWFWPSS